MVEIFITLNRINQEFKVLKIEKDSIFVMNFLNLLLLLSYFHMEKVVP